MEDSFRKISASRGFVASDALAGHKRLLEYQRPRFKLIISIIIILIINSITVIIAMADPDCGDVLSPSSVL